MLVRDRLGRSVVPSPQLSALSIDELRPCLGGVAMTVFARTGGLVGRCHVLRCTSPVEAIPHRDPILWRLCHRHQQRAGAILRDLPGLNRGELLDELGGDGRPRAELLP